MQRALSTLFLGIVALLVACVPPQLATELAELRQAVKRLQDQQTATHAALESLDNRLELEVRWIWSDRLCKSGKIAEFVGQLQAAVPEVCTPTSLETSLFFMNNNPYAITYLRPSEGIAGLHPSRRGRLKELLEPRSIHRSTRLVVLVQPHEETSAGSAKAFQIGEAFAAVVRTEMLKGQKVPVLGPFLLPCRLKSEIKRTYNKPLDRPFYGEPDEKEPRVRIWLFISDC